MPPRLIAILSFLFLVAPHLSAADERPNFVVMMADDLGFADLGGYGSEIATPRLDSLAARGLRFTQFYNTAKCHSSRVSLLTGLYCGQAGNAKLSRGATFAEVLAGAGYHTAMVGKWHLDGEPTDFGFHRYWGHLSGATNYFTGDDTFRLDGEAWPVPEELNGRPFYTTHAIGDFACEFLEEAIEGEAPFLLYVAFNAPHYPLQAPEEAVREYEGRYDAGWDEIRAARHGRQLASGLLPAQWKLSPRPAHVPAWTELDEEEQRWEADRMDAFAAMVETMDRSVGRVVDLLEAKGELANTLLLFCSDNGACPFERTRGRYTPPWDPASYWTYDAGWAHVGNTPFRLYKQNQHEGGISSPLIAHWPAGLVAETGAITDQPGHLIDIMATLVELAGAEYPPRIGERVIAPLQGRSLLPILRGETREPHESLYFHFGTDRALRQGAWKLVSAKKGRWELYDLDADRTELEDLAAVEPARVEAMEEEWFRFAEEVDRLEGQGLAPVGKERKELSFRKDTRSGSVKQKGNRAEEKRPNILWITSEDHGPHLGCYGDEYATTPNLDAFAERGMRFGHVWSCAPVCAPARTTIITGLYPPSIGAQHMRSMVALPPAIRFFPSYLRDQGYYCTNNAKTDYNATAAEECWDASSRKAHYRDRAEGQPFFAIFNSTVSHESRLRKRPHEAIHDPAGVRVPAYHPDLPEVRQDWAQYYDTVTAADGIAGEHLAALAEAGLADDTIVFYFSDHGSGMPRHKRWPYDPGLSVPMIVYFPPAWEHLAPAEYSAGATSDRLVSFVDLAPTMLSLAGVPPPAWMQGSAFAGAHQQDPPRYMFGFRGRMDERYDCIRTVTDGRYQYLRNYRPDLPYGQHVQYNFQTPSTAAWKRAFDAGELSEPQARFWRVKPAEELYDLHHDPDEVVNLVGSPAHAEFLVDLRAAQRAWCGEIRDLGFLPEGEIHSRSVGSTPYEMARDEEAYPRERIQAAAELATGTSLPEITKLEGLLSDPDPAVRYWGAIGFLRRGGEGLSAMPAPLATALEDPSPFVAIIAARALGEFGTSEERNRSLARLLELAPWTSDGDVFVSLAAANALDHLDTAAASALDELRALPRTNGASPSSRYDGYVRRVLDKAVEDLAEVR